MIIVTGAAGFIGSCMVKRLNDAGYAEVLAVDDFSRPDKHRNLEGKQLWGRVNRLNFVRWLERNHHEVDAVIHLGARTDTTETNVDVFNELSILKGAASLHGKDCAAARVDAYERPL